MSRKMQLKTTLFLNFYPDLRMKFTFGDGSVAGPKDAPGGHRMAPRGPQDGLKRVQKGPKMTPRGPKRKRRWRTIG